MIIAPIRTHKITIEDKDLLLILDKYLPSLKDGSVVAITSKIVSICEGRVIKIGKVDKPELIRREAEYYLPPEQSKYNITLTIKDGLLAATAGIDESNGNGYYVLWPRDPQKAVNQVREYLAKKFSLSSFGVIITDSKSTPLRRGVIGASIAHSGFKALKNYIGEPDIFGHKLKVTKANVADALGVAAVLVMGEGGEQTPLAVMENLPFVEFENNNPTEDELRDLSIPTEDDLYA